MEEEKPTLIDEDKLLVIINDKPKSMARITAIYMKKYMGLDEDTISKKEYMNIYNTIKYYLLKLKVAKLISEKEKGRGRYFYKTKTQIKGELAYGNEGM